MPIAQTVKIAIPQSASRVMRKGLSRVQRITLRGTAVECPVCGSKFRRFASFGDPARPNAQCPQCGSLERHRLTWLFLEHHTTMLSDEHRVLHVAPEPAIMRRLRSLSNLDYLTADLDPKRADVRMDITDVAFPDGHFDVVLCSNVLEHVDDANRAMQELCRVLSPTGFALLDVPIDHSLEDTYEDWSITSPRERAKAFGQFNHVRWFGRNFPDLLRAAGFVVVVDPHPPCPDEARRFGLRDADQGELPGRDPLGHIYFCTRKEPRGSRQ